MAGGERDRRRPAQDAGRTLRVRMYNVGFGDAFLLFVPVDGGERLMLVDCGVHPGGVRNRISAVVADIVGTVRERAGRLDVVVATHRHADHVSGFALRAWSTVDVGEVWLPWTEHPTDPQARRIREAQRRLALQLEQHLGTGRGKAGWLAVNSLSNADAMRTLQRGFRSCELRRYLPDRRRDQRQLRTPVLPGVTVHALGPSHDPAVIATLRPPVGSYFPAAARPAGGGPAAAAGAELFDERFRLTPGAARAAFPRLFENGQLEELRRRADAEVDLLTAASALEDAINGTSLVLALDFEDSTVLLAGDAEWGTWSEVLADDTWRDVLRRTALYKVSHHGSYNGTPPQFVDELLPDTATSMVSLREMPRWPSIPRKSLLAALAAGGRTLVRSDDPPAEDDRIRRHPDDLWVEVAIRV